MKILLIHPHDIFSPDEPWTVRIVSLAAEFRRKGHEVRLAFCPVDPVHAPAPGEYAGITLIRLARSAGIAAFLGNMRAVCRAAAWADVIHFQKCFHYVSLPALIAGCLLGRRLHYDWDDWEEKIWYYSNRPSAQTWLFGHFIGLLERLLPCLADTVSVASSKLAVLCRSFGVAEDRIFPAPVGADLQRFSPEQDGSALRQKYSLQGKTVVLYLGQLHGCQYAGLFIRAAALVSARCPHACFMIVGRGYLLESLKEQAAGLGIAGSVVFTGAVDHASVPEHIAASDICVASFEDNDVTACKSPLKIVEYMASGKPIVASRVGEVTAMLSGCGLTVPAGDAAALAEGIVRFAADPALRSAYGRKARQRAEDLYNWQRTAETLVCAYTRRGGR